MTASTLRIDSLETLRNYVNEMLCQCEQLEPDAFPMTERILVRGDQPCGIYYCVHGPRSVKITAIWETDSNTLLFYNCSGERFHKVKLIESPSLQPASPTTRQPSAGAPLVSSAA